MYKNIKGIFSGADKKKKLHYEDMKRIKWIVDMWNYLRWGSCCILSYSRMRCRLLLTLNTQLMNLIIAIKWLHP